MTEVMWPCWRADERISMAYFLLIGCLVGAWAFLRVLAGERERQLMAVRADIEQERQRAAEEAARLGKEL